MYQIKATAGMSVVRDRAATAVDALRIFRKTQAMPMLRACTILRKGVIISSTDLERDARNERG